MNHGILLRFSLPVLLLGLLSGAAAMYVILQPDNGLYVTFKNTDTIAIESIQLNFGNAIGQSDLLTLRLPPGEARLLHLNHEPGMGFNVKVRYADGQQQEFCAGQADDKRKQTLLLKR